MPTFVSRSAVGRVHDAFRLRGALLGLLASAPLTDAECATITTSSACTWNLVLTAECCAVAVAAALRRVALRELLPDDVRAQLDVAELREAQRIVTARGVLRTVDDVAQRVGASPVVVKGAAAAMDPTRTPVDLGDIDLLVTAADTTELWEALRECGWSPESEGLSPYDREAETRNHFAPLLPPGAGLPLELHRNLNYGDLSSEISRGDTLPVPGYRALRRLSGRAALVTSLRHAVLKHPFRRGHLRDLVMLSDDAALDEHLDFAEVEQALLSEPYAPELTEMLAQVQALHAHRRPTDSLATRRFVAWKYGSLLGANWAFREWAPGWRSVSFRALERPAVRHVEYRKQLSYGLRAVPADSPLRRRTTGRRLGGFSELGLRIARSTYRFVLVLLLVAVGWYLRRCVAALVLPDTRDDSNRARGRPSSR